MRTFCYQVSTTLPSRAGAEKLGRMLVEKRLAACWQVIGPIKSIYWWQGRVETGREWLCLAKTTDSRLEPLIRAISHSHPYDTPEIIAFPIRKGSRRYLDWVKAEVGAAKRRKQARKVRL